jgi:glycerate kinase
MHIVIAPDKFKHALNSFEVADAIERGLKKAIPSTTIIKLPMADGGDGLLEVISHYAGAKVRTTRVKGPLFEEVTASWSVSKDGSTAFIEMAKASGLQLLKPGQYRIMKSSTYGTGELIKAAINSGVSEIVLGIGGSATNDGGIGMAAALSIQFLDKDDRELKPVAENLINIARIDVSGSILNGKKITVKVASDVMNTLCGPNGATYTYGPQKGANQNELKLLETGMLHYANIVKRDLGVDMLTIAGGGAAGGIGAGSVAFLNAKISKGIELVFDFSKAEEVIKQADYIITGEGKIDEQTLHGKVVAGIAELAQKHGKKVIALCGSLELAPEILKQAGLGAVFSIVNKPMPLEDALKQTSSLLENTAFSIGKLLK